MKPVVHGPSVDEQTRCVHHHCELDIIAIRFFCCDRYYPCYRCHQETADHPAQTWPQGSGTERAVLCGSCRTELTIDAYRSTARCPECGAAFNPRCALHHPLYFS